MDMFKKQALVTFLVTFSYAVRFPFKVKHLKMPSCSSLLPILFFIYIYSVVVVIGCIVDRMPSMNGLPQGDRICHGFRMLMLMVRGQQFDGRFLRIDRGQYQGTPQK